MFEIMFKTNLVTFFRWLFHSSRDVCFVLFVALLNMAAEVKLAEVEAEVAAVPAVSQRVASLKDKRAKKG